MASSSKTKEILLVGTIPTLTSSNFEQWLFAFCQLVMKNGNGKYGMSFYFFTTLQFIGIYNRMFPFGPFLDAAFVLLPHAEVALRDVEQDFPPLAEGADADAREAHEKAEIKNTARWERKQNDILLRARIIEAIKASMTDAQWKQIMTNDLLTFIIDSMRFYPNAIAFGALEQGGRIAVTKAEIARQIDSDEPASVFIRKIEESYRTLGSLTGRPTDPFTIRDTILTALEKRIGSGGSMNVSYNTLLESLATDGVNISDYTLGTLIVWVNNWEKVHFKTATADALSLSSVQTDFSRDMLREIKTLKAEVSELKRTSLAQGAGSQSGIAGSNLVSPQNAAPNPAGTSKKAKKKAAAVAAALAGGGGPAAIGGGAKQQQAPAPLAAKLCIGCNKAGHLFINCFHNPDNLDLTIAQIKAKK